MKKILVIRTHGDEFYDIYEDGSNLFIDAGGKLLEIIGFATSPLPPSEQLYIEPEAGKYIISKKIEPGRYIILKKYDKDWSTASKIMEILPAEEKAV